MAETFPLGRAMPQNAVDAQAYAGATTIPWYLWCCAIAVTSGSVGSAWDISWHESIGRDSFWTPAHMLIYLSGILAGLSCAYLILSTTFQKDSPMRAVSISMWGFRGPLGAFICAWGGLAMIASAPFDNWWHNSYGLDVKILSPPHILLALGMTAIRLGLLVLVLAEMNRAQGEYRVRLERLLFYAMVFLLALTIGISQELTDRVFMHGAKFYLVIALAAPIWIAAIARASDHRWAATIMTGMFTALHMAFTWVLPLFPAVPKLGPVYQNITHLVPPDFPVLLIVPAIVFDLVRRRIGGWKRWAQAVTLGAAFLASFIAVQWPFANFLMSPKSENWFFATNNYPYFVPPTSPWVQNIYVATEHSAGQFGARMATAFAVAMMMTWIGLAWGDWMRRVRR
ncbi:MAG: hypothetical protein WCA98_09995 [Candidatus Acidiferrales bacterium]